MTPILRVFPFAGLALIASATGVLAFDCGKAQTKVEKVICADPKLKAADDAMAASYDKLRATADAAAKDALRISQLRWIAQRENCSYPGAVDVPGCVADLTFKRKSVLTALPETGPGDGSDLAPWFVQRDGKKGGWDIGFDLVRYAQPQSDGEELFNREVEALTAPALLENSSLGTATEKVPADKIFAYSVALTPTYASKQLISALAEGYEDRGGAHPNGWSRSINVALDEGRRLSFGDLFPREATGIFAKLCSDQLIAARRVRNSDAAINLEEGADVVILDHVKDLENWSLRADKATILFDAYLIGSHAEGAYSCDLDMARLRAHALPGAPLPK